jgi:hypothetical protein
MGLTITIAAGQNSGANRLPIQILSAASSSHDCQVLDGNSLNQKVLGLSLVDR